ncbi:GAF domain-containing sensor histidine kinase [Niveibacterium umoris]|uniref:histidine kinase n=1 Tax=Niveibacterium umoris TaxID=1193620 RepID=A0A840BF46_9RHOO|nr:GAF domain-containing sensor histidine kinase [Niveibacterium umoris]MBB4012151.1 signal transduction histidine kinase [Niveibacterium umoris]
MSADPDRLDALLLRVSRSAAIDGGRLDEVYDLVLEAASEGLAVQRVSIWMLGERRAEICCMALLDRTAGSILHEPVTLTRETYPQYFAALDSERALLADDARGDPRTAEFRDAYLDPKGIRSMLDVPIRHRGEMVGIVCCEHVGAMRAWQPDEGRLVAALADVIGRAMTAHALQRSERALRELNQSLERRVADRTRELHEAMDLLTHTRDTLLEREKLAALGGLVAGIAHEVNTPLGVAVTASSTLRERLAEMRTDFANGRLTRASFAAFSEQAEDALTLLASNLDRANRLIRDFKRTAVDQVAGVRDRFVLAEVLESLVTSLRPETKRVPVTPRVECDASLVIDGYAGVIAQIVANLIVNSCRHAFAAHAEPSIQIVVTGDGDRVRLEYADNGHGIAPELQTRVFEPFFTTRRNDGGTGLGLNIVHNLVVGKLGGEISLESRPGEGVRFEIEFPRVMPAVV